MNGVHYGKPLLRIENVGLVRQPGNSVILREVNADILDVQQDGFVRGQVVGFLGPSGIGKTTLCEIIAGLLPPTTGSVCLDETNVPVERGQIGLVYQHYPLFEHRTVMGNLVVAGHQAGLSDEQAKEKARQLLEQFELADRANHWPAQLSGGQRQRASIAQQLMCSEYFVLMDEPFSGLDVIVKDKVCRLISAVAGFNERNTIIVVTHDVESAVRISDRIWMMGRDRDQNGAFIPGARIMTQFDLIERGLAWQPDLEHHPSFADTVREIKDVFRQL